MHARSRTPRNGSVPGGTGWETDGTRAKRGKHLEILRERGGNAELIYSVAHYPRAGWWPVQALLPVKETTHIRPQRNKRQSHPAARSQSTAAWLFCQWLSLCQRPCKFGSSWFLTLP